MLIMYLQGQEFPMLLSQCALYLVQNTIQNIENSILCMGAVNTLSWCSVFNSW